MSGLLRLASCTAFSPAGGAGSRAPAARSVSGTPSAALLLSGGLHLAALALFLFAAARSGSDEPRQMEMRVLVDPGFRLAPPPAVASGSSAGRRVDPRGRLTPTTEEPVLEQEIETFPGEIPDRGVPGDPNPRGGERSGLPAGNPPPAPPETEVVTNYDEPPVPVYAPEPEYPGIALEAGIEGRVLVEALVGRDGHVRSVVIKSGDPILAASAASAVKTWRFKPGRWQGRAVTTWVAVPVVFRIH